MIYLCIIKKMPKKENYVITRIREDLRSRLSNLAQKKNTTITALTNKAVETFLEENEYTFEDIEKVIDQADSLRVYKEIIKKELEDCPSSTCKDLLDIIKNTILFQESFETIRDRINSLDKKDLFGIFLHISMKNFEINKVNEITSYLKGYIETNSIKASAGTAKNAITNKILLFASYDKKGEKNNE